VSSRLKKKGSFSEGEGKRAFVSREIERSWAIKFLKIEGREGKKIELVKRSAFILQKASAIFKRLKKERLAVSFVISKLFEREGRSIKKKNMRRGGWFPGGATNYRCNAEVQEENLKIFLISAKGRGN